METNKTPEQTELAKEFMIRFGTGTLPIDKTRLIGITQAEHDALKRGATLILGQPGEGSQPIVVGQELLAIVGYAPGEEPRMDAERVRLRVTGETFDLKPINITTEQVGLVTGTPTRFPFADFTVFLQAVCAEIKSFDPATSKIAIPVEVQS